MKTNRLNIFPSTKSFYMIKIKLRLIVATRRILPFVTFRVLEKYSTVLYFGLCTEHCPMWTVPCILCSVAQCSAGQCIVFLTLYCVAYLTPVSDGQPLSDCQTISDRKALSDCQTLSFSHLTWYSPQSLNIFLWDFVKFVKLSRYYYQTHRSQGLFFKRHKSVRWAGCFFCRIGAVVHTVS